MNNHDWENLQFLLNADEETLRDWYDKMDIDDHEYASEIMTMYSSELKTKEVLIDDTEIYIFDKANAVLEKFKL